MRTKIALIVALFCVCWCIGMNIVHGDMRMSPEYSLPMDHHKYLKMATSDVGDFRIAPFCWRVGVPAMARLLGGGDAWFGFQMLSILGIALACTFTGLLVWDKTHSLTLVSGSVLTLLSMGWITRYSLWNPATVDAMAFGLLATIVYLVHRRRFTWALLLLVVGVLSKESVLIALIIAPIVVEATQRRKVFFSLLPAVIPIMLVRLLIPSGNADPSYLSTLPNALTIVQNGTSEYSLSYLWHFVGLPRIFHPSVEDVYALSLDSFGAVVVGVLLYGAVRTTAERRAVLVVLFLNALQAAVAVNIQRPILMISPFVCAFVWYNIVPSLNKMSTSITVTASLVLLLWTSFGVRMSAPALVQGVTLAIVAVSVLYGALVKDLHRTEIG